jgi:hypothetical protein
MASTSNNTKTHKHNKEAKKILSRLETCKAIFESFLMRKQETKETGNESEVVLF